MSSYNNFFSQDLINLGTPYVTSTQQVQSLLQSTRPKSSKTEDPLNPIHLPFNTSNTTLPSSGSLSLANATSDMVTVIRPTSPRSAETPRANSLSTPNSPRKPSPPSVPQTPAQMPLLVPPQTDTTNLFGDVSPTHGNPDEIKQPRSCFKMKLISTIAIIAGALLAIVGTILFPFMPPVGIGCWIGAGSLFTSGLGTKAVISCVDPT